MISMDFKKNDNIVLVIGKTEGHLEQTIFAREVLSEKKGPPPEINLFNEKNNGLTISKLIKDNLIESCHDVSLGGILIAIAKMCIKGNKGIKINDCLKKILSNPNISGKKWVWEQYDHTVMGDTIQKPGGNSGVVRVHGTQKAIAATIDSSATYCYAHPNTGGKQTVCESWRNLISVGASPIAITNCLNFGNPEKEKNMGEFVECVEGMSEASKYLNFPVVSGNVSFYNETKDKGIKPTPTIGGVGLIKNY